VLFNLSCFSVELIRKINEAKANNASNESFLPDIHATDGVSIGDEIKIRAKINDSVFENLSL